MKVDKKDLLALSRYLQFMFNLSLILLFLYLLVQFIFTIQKDVEERVSEYSQGRPDIQFFHRMSKMS